MNEVRTRSGAGLVLAVSNKTERLTIRSEAGLLRNEPTDFAFQIPRRQMPASGR